MPLVKFNDGNDDRAIEWERVFAVLLAPHHAQRPPAEATLYVDLFEDTTTTVKMVGRELQQIEAKLAAAGSGFESAGLLYYKKQEVCHIRQTNQRGGNGSILFDMGDNRSLEVQVHHETIELLLAGL